MSILNRSGSNVPPSSEGFAWSIKISEKVLVTLFIAGASFASGYGYGHPRANSQPSVLPEQPATCSPTAANNRLRR
ncbi:hypothetical protein H6F86_10600 [Phormidium sp. FACHB-592]|uniref:Uncharacterized protein n=1 Tax=Stenomitos frigidus AS-A4 TaxID=2933935 RepID=A0ABV0KUD2_9CYAN|nr:hypothetical protein [Phormidium sp. FACHB-592]MBD2074326.1 hypothetical protein [Phormidium sp. FACHB-592]